MLYHDARKREYQVTPSFYVHNFWHDLNGFKLNLAQTGYPGKCNFTSRRSTTLNEAQIQIYRITQTQFSEQMFCYPEPDPGNRVRPSAYQMFRLP
jgi:hypothetical protein